VHVVAQPDGSPPDRAADTEAVREANRTFYAAFEARDLDAMSDLWAHDAEVTCVHPGWVTLRGWGQVAASWAALFDGPQRLQFIVTDEEVVVAGDVAWVTCDENLLGDEGGATVAVLNLFARDPEGRWRMLAHHGSPVMGRSIAAEAADADDR
jgi:ketosteroid isomerase-like protein